MQIARKALLHSDRGAAAADIAGERQELLQGKHFYLFIAGYFCELFQINLRIHRDHRDEIAAPITVEDERLEEQLVGNSQTIRGMAAAEIRFIHRVRPVRIWNFRLVQKAHHIGLDFFLLCHDVSFKLYCPGDMLFSSLLSCQMPEYPLV